MSKQPLNKQANDTVLFPEDTPGQRIKKLRIKHGLNQKQLSRLLGFTANYFGQVERDEKPLSKNMADALCNYFHVSYSYLYHGIHPFQTGEYENVTEAPAYGHNIRMLLNEYIKSCSEDECRMLEPIIKSLVSSLRDVRWFDLQNTDHIKDES